jgi:uncharacterized protein YyaL (SSP411 family)
MRNTCRVDLADSPLSKPVEMAVHWLLNSGIYVLSPDSQNYGAVFSHYQSGRRDFELVYAEATGYVISLLKYLSRIGPSDSLVAHARASGDWLATWAERHNGIIAMGIRQGEEVREAYAFDNGVCCKGFLDLYELTSDKRYLTCAERIADWLLNRALNDDGSVKPVYDFDSAEFKEDRSTWYKVSGSFQSKIAMPLLQLSGIIDEKRFRDAALKICNWAIGQQTPRGSFPVNKAVKATYLHFHSYTVEALLYAYGREREQHFLQAAEKAIDWALSVQGPDGVLPRWHGRGPIKNHASDVQAQALRLFSLVRMLTRRAELAEALPRTLNPLLNSQRNDRDPRTWGGFIEGSETRYRIIPRKSFNMTSWATMFAIHAVDLVKRADSGDFCVESDYLF